METISEKSSTNQGNPLNRPRMALVGKLQLEVPWADMAKIHPIYNFKDYREYLSASLDGESQGRGSRRRLAEHLQCQPSFVSQVLSGKNEISLEHAYRINDFLSHSSDESHYFMSLVLLSKAGSTELRDYYDGLIRDLRSAQLQVEKVIKSQEIKGEDALQYYSDWLCISIHMLVAVPKYQSIDALKKKLSADDEDFEKALRFLTDRGLVTETEGRLKTGTSHIHLKKGSVYAQAASVFMRQKVIESLDLQSATDLNYSLAFTLSEEAITKIRTKILNLISEIGPLIDGDEPSRFYTLTLDLIEQFPDIRKR